MDMSNRNFIRQGSHASDSTATNSVATLQKNFLNFCLLGAPRVGKSAVLAALEEKPFSFKYFSTINVYEGVIVSVCEWVWVSVCEWVWVSVWVDE